MEEPRTEVTPRRGTRTLIAGLTGASVLVLAATALAALRRKDQRGEDRGFSAPVSFKVSSSGTRLQGFTYGATGCFGLGTAIRVAHNGHFSIASDTSTFHSNKFEFTYTTTPKVSARFTTRRSPIGTISISQTYQPQTGTGSSCTGSTPLTFKVKLR